MKTAFQILADFWPPRENRPTFKATKCLSGVLTLFWSARTREHWNFKFLRGSGAEWSNRFAQRRSVKKSKNDLYPLWPAVCSFLQWIVVQNVGQKHPLSCGGTQKLQKLQDLVAKYIYRRDDQKIVLVRKMIKNTIRNSTKNICSIVVFLLKRYSDLGFLGYPKYYFPLQNYFKKSSFTQVTSGFSNTTKFDPSM